jgi:hypothetical protein
MNGHSRDTGNTGHKKQNANNPETQATLGTRNRAQTIQRHRQHWTQETERRQSRDTGNTGHKKQNADNPETQATLDTRNRTQTIQRHRQHWTQETECRQTEQQQTKPNKYNTKN